MLQKLASAGNRILGEVDTACGVGVDIDKTRTDVFIFGINDLGVFGYGNITCLTDSGNHAILVKNDTVRDHVVGHDDVCVYDRFHAFFPFVMFFHFILPFIKVFSPFVKSKTQKCEEKKQKSRHFLRNDDSCVGALASIYSVSMTVT